MKANSEQRSLEAKERYEEQQRRIAEARAEERAREAAAQMRHDERMRLERERLDCQKKQLEVRRQTAE